MPFINKLPSGNRSIIIIGLIILFVIWAASGIYTVGPDQQAATRMFGKFQSIQGNGLHWWWPSPIGQRDTVVVTATRQLELGFRSEGQEMTKPVTYESMMITGDENLVDVQTVIQYKIIPYVLDKKDVLGLDLEGKVFDCGDKLGYLKAIVEFAKNNKSIGKNFSSFLNSLIKKNK